MKPIPSILSALLLISAISVPCASRAETTLNSTDEAAIQQAVTDLDHFRQTIFLQNADVAVGMKKAILLADLLLSPEGKLNLNRIQAVQPYFISPTPLDYEVDLARCLNQLDESWQPFVDSVQKPTNLTSDANKVIRALFGLSAAEQITDRHAKMAVLAALFAPYNQGSIGDCFAVNVVIREHEEYFKNAARDYAAIVQHGYLTRAVGTGIDHFFFLPILADDDLKTQISIDSEGKLANTHLSFLEVPGLVAAVKVMGGSAVQKLSDHTIYVLRNFKDEKGMVYVSDVIKALSQVIASENSSLNAEDLAAMGQYAFSSLTANPVLRATESAFAGMAEELPDGYVRSNINTCVTTALKNAWPHALLHPIVKDFQPAFAQVFNDSFRLIYNLNIPLAQVSADGSSSSGGFQLYERTIDPTIIGLRKATPQDFVKLVADAVDATAVKLGKTKEALDLAEKLKKTIQSGNFARDALWDYDPANKQESDPVANYQKLSRTPMQSCDGDNPFEVDEINTKESNAADLESFTPKNSKDLITWCLNLSKKVPAEMLAMVSPQHAFNFEPFNPDLAAFVASAFTSDQWISRTLIVPGTKISKKTIDAATQQAVANGLWELVNCDQTAYQNLVQKLSDGNLTVQKYAQGLTDGVNALLGSDDNQAYAVGQAVDAILLRSLPAADLKVLEQSAIRFAFTNWNDGGKDIYFCGFFNPRTQLVAFGTIDEDKTSLAPMDETQWVNNLPWSVDTHPYAPVNPY